MPFEKLVREVLLAGQLTYDNIEAALQVEIPPAAREPLEKALSFTGALIATAKAAREEIDAGGIIPRAEHDDL